LDKHQFNIHMLAIKLLMV